jgi:uncharacterized membrane protein
MALFLTGLVLFLGVHLIRVVAPDARLNLQQSLGINAYRGLYALVSILSLCLLIYGFGQARMETGVLYDPPVALRHIALLLMLIAFIVLAAGFLPSGYIATYTKHPQILSIKIWALAHLLANGETAQVILFAGFLAWGVIMRISYKRRARRGESVDRVYKSWTYDAIAIAIGVVLYGAFAMKLHELLIGVPVLGM